MRVLSLVLAVVLLVIVPDWPGVAQNAEINRISCLGQIVPGERTMVLSAPEGSVMGQLLVKRGDQVASGAEIGRLRDFDIQEAAVAYAKEEIALAEADLALVQSGERAEAIAAQRAVVTAREAAVRLHQSRKDRNERLRAESVLSDDAFDDVAYAFEAAKAELLREKNVLTGMLSGREEEIRRARARVAVAAAKHRLELAHLEVQRIRAPINGEVLAIHAYSGEAVIERGILELADTGNMMIVAEVYETDIARVKPGSRARIRSAVFAGDIAGEVVEIEHKCDAGRIFALDPLRHSDRRIVPVRIKPAAAADLSRFTNAQVTVIITPP